MKIRIDASNCTSVIQGYSRFKNGMYDYWYYDDLTFEMGKSYGIVSEYQQGCMYVSYLLGGQIDLLDDGLKIYLDDLAVSSEDLDEMSWNLEPSFEKYKDRVVKRSIERALKIGYVQDTFENIAEKFLLSEKRYNMRLRELSGERWSASAALGYALGKKIFYAPYNPSMFYSSNFRLKNMIDFLTSHGCMVLLPVGSSTYIKECVDECVVLEQKTDWWKPEAL